MFVARKNSTRYRQMLAQPHDDAQRQLLQRMLAEEEKAAGAVGAIPRPFSV
jgi:hypothetical protein